MMPRNTRINEIYINIYGYIIHANVWSTVVPKLWVVLLTKRTTTGRPRMYCTYRSGEKPAGWAPARRMLPNSACNVGAECQSLAAAEAAQPLLEALSAALNRRTVLSRRSACALCQSPAKTPSSVMARARQKQVLPQGEELTAQQLQSRNGNAQSHADLNE